MERNNPSDKLDVYRAAEVLGVSPYSLRAWIRTKRVPHFKCGRRVVLARADLDQFLASCRVNAKEWQG